MVRNNSLPDSAGFLIRFGCRFTASRANSASPQTVPLVAVANPNLIDGICASIRSIMLFVSIFRLVRPYLPFSCLSLLLLTLHTLLPSTPQKLTALRGGSPSRTQKCGVEVFSLFGSFYAAIPIKYGARWNKRRTPGEGFP